MNQFVEKKQLNLELFSKYIEAAQTTNQFTNYGTAVQLLESRARQLLQISESKAVIATSSGASAFHAILLGMFVKHQESLSIYSQDFTFPCNFQGPAEHALPIDIDEFQQIDLSEETNERSVIVVTNCFGHLQDLNKIYEQVLSKNQVLVLDNAATPYSFINGTNSCNIGEASYVSLHHTKPIGFGEGGLAIVDKVYEQEVRVACNFGIKNYTPSKYGSNFKMSELAAAGILQWWDQFDIDLLATKYRYNYWKKLEQYTDTNITLFNHYGDEDKFFPNCLPLIHEHKTPVSAYPNEDAKKYYKPFYGRINSTKLYDSIVCLPVTGK